MAAKNDVLENEEVKATGLPPQEQVVMTQEELINGLFAAANYANDDDLIKTIEIKRGKKIYFRFDVRPLGEPELMSIRKKSTTYKPNPQGKHLPKIESEFRADEFKSRKIYEATCEKDKKVLWDNPVVKDGLNQMGKNILESWEIIDAVLTAGEKWKVLEVIDKISGDNDEDLTLEEYAKN